MACNEFCLPASHGEDAYGAPKACEDHMATCGACGLSWCEACDPTPSALCHRCHGRGYSHHRIVAAAVK